jgi:hypothetical protein
VKISNKFFSFFSSRNQYFPHIPYVASKNGLYWNRYVVRPSVRLSVRPSVRLCAIFRPVKHLESWNFAHRSVGVCVSIVRSGILDPWPRSPGFGPLPGPSPKKIRFSEHNLSSCYQNGTCECSFERSQHQECFLYWTNGHLRLWPTPQSGQSPKFSI